MKTFKQYLAEGETQELEDFIIERCHYFLSELDADVEDAINNPLYRGIDVSGESRKIKLLVDGKVRTCLIKNVRQDRKPRDTHPWVSEWTDNAFEEIFGWKPRSQALFCTGSRSQAEEYGQVYQIFPIGKFKYVWSPAVPDMITPVKQIMRDLNISTSVRMSNEKPADEKLADFFERISDFIGEKYKDDELYDVIGKPHEVMINCKQYLAVPV